MEKSLIIYIVLISFLSFSVGATTSCMDGNQGSNGCKQLINTMPIKHSLGVLAAKSFPTFPLDSGQMVLKTSGAFVDQSSKPDWSTTSEGEVSEGSTGQQTETESSGWGAAITYLWGRSKRSGFSFSAAYAKNSGYIKTTNLSHDAGDGILRGDHSDKGYFLAANYIYDPFAGFEKFRLPLFVGVSYSDVSGKWGPIDFTYESTGRSGNSGSVESTYNWGGPGWSFGVSMQYPTGPFRWVVFFSAVTPFTGNKTKYTQKDLTTGETVVYENEDEQVGGEGGGIELVYTPWNISIAYYPPFANDVDSGEEGESLTSISLSWSMDFGEKSAGEVKYDQIIKDVKSVVGGEEDNKQEEKPKPEENQNKGKESIKVDQ